MTGDRTGRLHDDAVERVRASNRTDRHVANIEALADNVAHDWNRISLLFVFDRPSRLCTVESAQIVDATVPLAHFPSFHEVRDGDGGQKTDDSDHDHDLDEGECGTA
jgi:hypothetical protein